MARLTHFNTAGDAHMVDVGGKAESRRIATAEGRIDMREETLQLVMEGKHKKGDVLAVARVAGIMAAKRTAELIPLCHPLPLSSIDIELSTLTDPPGIHCRAKAETVARTGVEMEALTAVQIALLTIYDMCKAIDREMSVEGVRLVSKSGGKSGVFRRAGEDGDGP